MNSDLRIVASVGTNKLWYGTIANSAASNDTLARFLMENGLTWMARGDIEANTAAGDFGAYVGLPNGIEGSAIAAVWSSGELVRDPYTKANEGSVVLTLNYLWGLAIPAYRQFQEVEIRSLDQ